MRFPDDRIDDFIKRWQNAFGETLSREEAQDKAAQLIEFYREVGRRPPSDGSTAPPAKKED